MKGVEVKGSVPGHELGTGNEEWKVIGAEAEASEKKSTRIPAQQKSNAMQCQSSRRTFGECIAVRSIEASP